ncbi:protein transporter Sec31 [Streptomyces sioyaensis]|uniref:protein transporter Sec31 n=1 Tax=Streptomyces sioyaensis TaxID=67364 RepID=UPI0037D8F830
MKYRTEHRTREVPHTENGETVLIPDDYTVRVPVPPRDWDHIVLNAVTGGAIAFTAVSVVWSTVSAGALLDRAAPAWAAYPAALAFDAAWMTCQALEWLARYDPDRASAPRRVGYAALAIAMVVIYVHGATTPGAGRWVGLAGAAISAIAKGLWTLVLRHTAVPLPERTQAWLRVKRGQNGARLALAGQERDLLRMDDRYNALVASGLTPAALPVPLSRAEQDGRTEPVPPVVPAPPAPQDNVPPPVAPPVPPAQNPAPVPAPQDNPNPNVLPLSPGRTLTDAVRAAIKAGAEDKCAALRHVMATHGDDVNGASVIRIYNRLTKMRTAN